MNPFDGFETLEAEVVDLLPLPNEQHFSPLFQMSCRPYFANESSLNWNNRSEVHLYELEDQLHRIVL